MNCSPATQQIVLHEVPLRAGSVHVAPSPQAEAEHVVMEPEMRLEPLVRNALLSIRTDAVPRSM